jgi:hypothetical protein
MGARGEIQDRAQIARRRKLFLVVTGGNRHISLPCLTVGRTIEKSARRGKHWLGFPPNSYVSASRRLTSGQKPGDDVSRVEQDGFVLLRRDLDEA